MMKLFKVLLVVIVALISLTSVAASKDAICNLPGGVNGDGKTACLAYIPSWSYRAGSNECVQFIYGGCGGNENRFPTQYECENKCKE